MKQEEQWLIAVTAGHWQMHGIREAKLAGLKVIAIDADPAAEGFSISDLSILGSLDDFDIIIKKLKKLSLNFCGTVSFCSEAGMKLAARIREEFLLPGPDMTLTLALLDKGIQRKIWTDYNVPGPQWKVFNDFSEAIKILLEFPLPFIIKPTDSSGSRGVTKIESLDSTIFEEAIKRAFRFSKSGKIIVESFMEGIEFTVEVFVIHSVVNVLAVTEKKKVEGTKGTVASELATTDRPAKIVEEIRNAVIEAFKALNYTDGPGHAEIILKKDGSLGLVEVAGRGGGFMVFNGLVPVVSNINIARLTALQAVGKQVEISNLSSNAAVLRFFPSISGKLISISGFEIANQIPGVVCASFVEVGSCFPKAEADGDRLGYILSYASTLTEAKKLANNAEKMIHFEIKSMS